MKLYLLLTLIFLNLFVKSAFAKDQLPCWAVDVFKGHTDGKIRGTGYIVRFQGELFLRTAAHVVLGSPQGLSLKDCRGKEIKYFAKDFVTNSGLDDFLVRIEAPTLLALGTYHPGLRTFVVNREAFESSKNYRRWVWIENQNYVPGTNDKADMLFSAPWIKRSNYRYKERRRNPFLRGVGETFFESEIGSLRNALVSDISLADMSVIPGESGAPVIGYNTRTSLEMEDINFGIMVSRALSSGLFDERGLKINPVVDPYYGSLLMIKGHALSYHRSFLLSRFLSARTFERVQSEYKDGRRGEVSSSSWLYEGGLSFRRFEKDGVRVDEVDTSGLSGNGTGGDGGNGTGGDGGNGTGGDGGNGQSHNFKLLNFGLLINERPALAFHLSQTAQLRLGRFERLKNYFKNKTFLQATWNNFLVLSEISAMNGAPVYSTVYRDENLSSFLDERFASIPSSSVPHLSCRVDRKAFESGILQVEIQLGQMRTDETFTHKVKLDRFRALIGKKTKTFGDVEIDLSGIFGHDLSFIGPTLEKRDLAGQIPYIMLKADEFLIERFQCGLQ